ncbi:MAG: YbjN domain-containing protein [Myxococcota bacterium]|nr:YbjN domain-containing protein [Myxococcota bacterium]
MSSLLQILAEFLESINWRWELVDDNGNVLGTTVEGENGRFTCYGHAHDGRQQLVFYSLCPVQCPPERRQAMAELLARINFGMILGNFELDFGDGEIRYKTALDTEHLEFSAEGCRQLVFPNCMMMDRYLPAIRHVADDQASPEGAIAALSMDDDELLN